MNILKLESPDSWSCQVSSFDDTHNEMTVIIRHPDRRIWYTLHFRHVEYLVCPMGWQGANFEVVPQDEKMELVAQYYSKAHVSGSLWEATSLYRCQSVNRTQPILIFANVMCMNDSDGNLVTGAYEGDPSLDSE